jgi:hypothetical protein
MAYKNDYIEYYIQDNMDEPILKYPDIYYDNDASSEDDNKEKKNKISSSTQKEENVKPKSFYAKFKYHIGLFIKKIYNFCNKIFH